MIAMAISLSLYARHGYHISHLVVNYSHGYLSMRGMVIISLIWW